MRNIRPRKKSKVLWLEGNVNSHFCWAGELYQKGGEMPYCVLHSICRSLASTACLQESFQSYLGNRAKDSQDFLDSCPSFTRDNFWILITPSMLSQVTHLSSWVLNSLPWQISGDIYSTSQPLKKLVLYKAFTDVKIHRETCMRQHCWVSVVCKASYSFQWASWPCPRATKGHPARLEDRNLCST